MQTWKLVFLLCFSRKVGVVGSGALAPLTSSPLSTSLYYKFLLSGLWNIDDQHRNTNMNDKDHLVGQLTGGGKGVKFPGRPSLPNVSVSLAYKEAAWKEKWLKCIFLKEIQHYWMYETITNGIIGFSLNLFLFYCLLSQTWFLFQLHWSIPNSPVLTLACDLWSKGCTAVIKGLHSAQWVCTLSL